jgi:hypothetical protein
MYAILFARVCMRISEYAYPYRRTFVHAKGYWGKQNSVVTSCTYMNTYTYSSLHKQQQVDGNSTLICPLCRTSMHQMNVSRGQLEWACTGGCGVGIIRSGAVYVCSHCLGPAFCEGCAAARARARVRCLLVMEVEHVQGWDVCLLWR